jgi:hypothetical protein
MRARQLRLSARAIVTGLSMLALAACHRSDADQNGSIIVNEQAAAPVPVAAPMALPASATADRIEPLSAVTPTPLPRTAPGEGMRTHKTFTDPPLPRELKDDGGLKPLPPPPISTPHPGT